MKIRNSDARTPKAHTHTRIYATYEDSKQQIGDQVAADKQGIYATYEDSKQAKTLGKMLDNQRIYATYEDSKLG